MRDLSEVIDRIIAVIPDGNDRTVELLKNVKKSCPYVAPELYPNLWRKCRDILCSNFGNPEGCEWKMEISNIFTGKEGASSESPF